MDDIAIKVDKVAKDFLLLHDKARTIKSLFTSLSKRRRKNREVLHALKDVSLEVKKGEFFGIVGRNGSGKSTLLKMLAGIYQPTAGIIKVNGKLVPFIELGVGFNPELTGRENVYLNGAMMGFSTKETDAMYDEIVAFAELKEFMDQKLKNYSSGMQVRLAFSVAIKAQADVLLIDEVLAVGDAAFQRKCYRYFKSLKNNKQTVVFVTHDMNAVQEYCDRALLIQDGVVAKEGPADKIAAEYLKMFNKPGGDITGSEESDDRWGSKELSFSHIAVNVSEDKINLDFEVKNNQAQEIYKDLLLNIDLRDIEGKLVAGNNFKVKPELKIAKGKKKTLSVTIDNNFGGGDHLLDVSLTSSDRLTVYDHWNSAKRIENIAGRNTYFPIIASGKLEVR